MKAAKRSPEGSVEQIAQQAAAAEREVGAENQPDDGDQAQGQEEGEEEAETDDEAQG